MPRQQRRKGESGIYHVMLRGINQQQIFKDDEDNSKFLEILLKCKAISEFELYAYCFMGNHVHILLKEGKEPLELIFKRIGSRYVYWYNAKYQRIGHLFQDRFRSEPVETEEYFLTVVRYIHQNPLKAGMVKDISKYEYSSYNEYFSQNSIIDSAFLLSIIPIKEYEKYHMQDEEKTCLEIKETKPRLTDEQAQKLYKELSGCTSAEQFQNLPIDKQNELISELRQANISIRQINRLTGISLNLIRKF